MNFRVEEYIRPDGSSPYADWFNGLDSQAAAKVVTAKLRMELGNISNVKWFAGIVSTSSIGVRATGSTLRRMATH
jgi:putative component of toxin-antitoxin plasmid stabilization module